MFANILPLTSLVHPLAYHLLFFIFFRAALGKSSKGKLQLHRVGSVDMRRYDQVHQGFATYVVSSPDVLCIDQSAHGLNAVVQ